MAKFHAWEESAGERYIVESGRWEKDPVNKG